MVELGCVGVLLSSIIVDFEGENRRSGVMMRDWVRVVWVAETGKKSNFFSSSLQIRELVVATICRRPSPTTDVGDEFVVVAGVSTAQKIWDGSVVVGVEWVEARISQKMDCEAALGVVVGKVGWELLVGTSGSTFGFAGLGQARELRGVAQQVSSRPSPKPTGKTRLVE